MDWFTTFMNAGFLAGAGTSSSLSPPSSLGASRTIFGPDVSARPSLSAETTMVSSSSKIPRRSWLAITWISSDWIARFTGRAP